MRASASRNALISNVSDSRKGSSLRYSRQKREIGNHRSYSRGKKWINNNPTSNTCTYNFSTSTSGSCMCSIVLCHRPPLSGKAAWSKRCDGLNRNAATDRKTERRGSTTHARRERLQEGGSKREAPRESLQERVTEAQRETVGERNDVRGTVRTGFNRMNQHTPTELRCALVPLETFAAQDSSPSKEYTYVRSWSSATFFA